jgi:hypothetical protein
MIKMNNSKGYVYIMDFGMFDEHHRLIKTGKSIDPKVRCGQHSKNGNKFLQGREGQVLLAVPVSYYNQERYEDKNRAIMDNTDGFTRAFHCKDTFLVDTRIVTEVSITIKKTYTASIV